MTRSHRLHFVREVGVGVRVGAGWQQLKAVNCHTDARCSGSTQRSTLSPAANKARVGISSARGDAFTLPDGWLVFVRRGRGLMWIL